MTSWSSSGPLLLGEEGDEPVWPSGSGRAWVATNMLPMEDPGRDLSTSSSIPADNKNCLVKLAVTQTKNRLNFKHWNWAEKDWNLTLSLKRLSSLFCMCAVDCLWVKEDVRSMCFPQNKKNVAIFGRAEAQMNWEGGKHTYGSKVCCYKHTITVRGVPEANSYSALSGKVLLILTKRIMQSCVKDK